MMMTVMLMRFVVVDDDADDDANDGVDEVGDVDVA